MAAAVFDVPGEKSLSRKRLYDRRSRWPYPKGLVKCTTVHFSGPLSLKLQGNTFHILASDRLSRCAEKYALKRRPTSWSIKPSLNRFLRTHWCLIMAQISVRNSPRLLRDRLKIRNVVASLYHPKGNKLTKDVDHPIAHLGATAVDNGKHD